MKRRMAQNEKLDAKVIFVQFLCKKTHILLDSANSCVHFSLLFALFSRHASSLFMTRINETCETLLHLVCICICIIHIFWFLCNIRKKPIQLFIKIHYNTHGWRQSRRFKIKGNDLSANCDLLIEFSFRFSLPNTLKELVCVIMVLILDLDFSKLHPLNNST